MARHPEMNLDGMHWSQEAYRIMAEAVAYAVRNDDEGR
jgi:lysophospholipase L1-like esterase